jgi:S-formylglutathione hydrolase FrmB
MAVILPENSGGGPYPVLYLLHGLSDDHTAWIRRTSIERDLRNRCLIVVMPDGHRSFYANDPRPGGLAYEDHILKDVIGFVEQNFPAIPERRARAVAGLSMGGYGAMMLALKHPDRFCAAVSHSGVLALLRKTPAIARPLPSALAPEAYDPFLLAEQAKARCNRKMPMPALRIDCGRDDSLLEHNRMFRAHLKRLHIAHEYQEHAGTHNWDYWDAHIPQTLDFVLRHVSRHRR